MTATASTMLLSTAQRRKAQAASQIREVPAADARREVRDADEVKQDLNARVLAMQAGDAAALEGLLRELLPDVRRWLLRLMGPRPDVDDAAQDALIELAKSLPTFRGQSKLTTFAHRVTVRVAYRYYKKRAAPMELREVFDDVAGGQDPEARAIEREALALLHEALATLPEKRRVAFVLCAIEGLTAREAAAIEGTSALAMRSRLHHARAAVDKHLKRRAQREQKLAGGRR